MSSRYPRIRQYNRIPALTAGVTRRNPHRQRRVPLKDPFIVLPILCAISILSLKLDFLSMDENQIMENDKIVSSSILEGRESDAERKDFGGGANYSTVDDEDAEVPKTASLINATNSSKPLSVCSEIQGSLLPTTLQDSNDLDPPGRRVFAPVMTFVHDYDKISNTTDAAICHYHCPMHDPHFMQELVRCFSFWRSLPLMKPVLKVPKPQFRRFLTNPLALKERFPFDYYILEGLKKAIGLQVVGNYEGISVRTQKFLERDGKVPPYVMRSRQDAIVLRDIFVSNNRTSVTEAKPNAPLKIGLVNRGGGRKLLNPDGMLATLQKAFPQHQVTLKYLDDATFDDKVDFYSQTDVLISPHGSQLTGIMFMHPCSAVVELFPHLYYTENYFSSLAKLSGLVHTNWYVSNEDVPESLSLATRLNNTNNDMCPSIDTLVSYVGTMIQQRKDCLAKNADATTRFS